MFLQFFVCINIYNMCHHGTFVHVRFIPNFYPPLIKFLLDQHLFVA